MKQNYSTRFSLIMVFALCVWGLNAQVYVNHSASGNNDGTSWADAYQSLDLALSNTTSGDIWVAAGTYHPGGDTPDINSVFAITSDVALYGGFNGTETELSQRDPGANVTILSGDLNNDDIQNNFTTFKTDNTLHVISVDSMLTNVTIDGFSIIGGNTTDDVNADIYDLAGGGIYAQSPVFIYGCNFYNNFGLVGGAVYLSSATGGSTVTLSTFDWNATDGSGAGIFLDNVDGLMVSECSFDNNRGVGTDDSGGAFHAMRTNDVQVDNCSFTFNVNSEGRGGALVNFASTNMNITNSSFSDNTAVAGGALYYNGDELMNMEGAGNFIITSCIFSDNQNTSSTGGAIRNRRGSYTLDDCIFLRNTSSGSGGHIRNDTNGDDVVYTNCVFEEGTSGGWGGAHTCYGPGNFTITDCEYINNNCANLGGAVNSGLDAYQITFTSCSFTGNSSNTASGGALYVQNDFTNLNVHDCYFENNYTPGSGGAIGVGGTQSTVVENSDFLFNVADGFGGGITFAEGDKDGSTLDILNSTFILNQAGTQGGGASIVDADASIVSCLFGENAALDVGTGGALSLNASDSNSVNMSILHCTIANNSGDLAAGIAQWTGTSEAFLNTTIQNSMLFNEDGANYTIEDGTPVLISNGGNMSSDATLEDVFTQSSDLNGEEPAFIDPDLFDYNLTTDSPGIDAGIAAGAPEFDILGNPRINLPDIGAYENQEVTGTHESIVENNGMLVVSPNPAKGNSTMATLQNDWAGELQVRITNYKGQMVNSIKIQKDNNEFLFELPLSELANGIYQVSVSNGEKMVVGKLIRL